MEEQTSLMQLLPLGEAARQIGVSAPYVHRLIEQGRINYVQTPLGRLLLPEDVARYASERQQRAARSKVSA